MHHAQLKGEQSNLGHKQQTTERVGRDQTSVARSPVQVSQTLIQTPVHPQQNAHHAPQVLARKNKVCSTKKIQLDN